MNRNLDGDGELPSSSVKRQRNLRPPTLVTSQSSHDIGLSSTAISDSHIPASHSAQLPPQKYRLQANNIYPRHSTKAPASAFFNFHNARQSKPFSRANASIDRASTAKFSTPRPPTSAAVVRRPPKPLSPVTVARLRARIHAEQDRRRASLRLTQSLFLIIFFFIALGWMADTAWAMFWSPSRADHWLVLYAGVLVAFYAFTTPFRDRVRRGEISYISFSLLHAAWLLSAALYHMPPLSALGVDVQLSTSLFLTIALATIAFLAVYHLVYMAVGFLSHWLFPKFASRKFAPRTALLAGVGADELWVLVRNALVISLFCAAAHSHCTHTPQPLTAVATPTPSRSPFLLAALLTQPPPQPQCLNPDFLPPAPPLRAVDSALAQWQWHAHPADEDAASPVSPVRRWLTWARSRAAEALDTAAHGDAPAVVRELARAARDVIAPDTVTDLVDIYALGNLTSPSHPLALSPTLSMPRAAPAPATPWGRLLARLRSDVCASFRGSPAARVHPLYRRLALYAERVGERVAADISDLADVSGVPAWRRGPQDAQASLAELYGAPAPASPLRLVLRRVRNAVNAVVLFRPVSLVPGGSDRWLPARPARWAGEAATTRIVELCLQRRLPAHAPECRAARAWVDAARDNVVALAARGAVGGAWSCPWLGAGPLPTLLSAYGGPQSWPACAVHVGDRVQSREPAVCRAAEAGGVPSCAGSVCAPSCVDRLCVHWDYRTEHGDEDCLRGVCATQLPVLEDGADVEPSAELAPVWQLWVTLVAIYAVNYVFERSASWALSHALSLEAGDVHRRAQLMLQRARTNHGQQGQARQRTCIHRLPASLPASVAHGHADARVLVSHDVSAFSSPTLAPDACPTCAVSRSLSPAAPSRATTMTIATPQFSPRSATPDLPALAEAVPPTATVPAPPPLLGLSPLGHALGSNARAQTPFDHPGEAPKFLPMVSWFSVTSWDMWQAAFDILVSFKLFHGRVDRRTIHAAQTTASTALSVWDAPLPAQPPAGSVAEELAGERRRVQQLEARLSEQAAALAALEATVGRLVVAAEVRRGVRAARARSLAPGATATDAGYESDSDSESASVERADVAADSLLSPLAAPSLSLSPRSERAQGVQVRLLPIAGSCTLSEDSEDVLLPHTRSPAHPHPHSHSHSHVHTEPLHTDAFNFHTRDSAGDSADGMDADGDVAADAATQPLHATPLASDAAAAAVEASAGEEASAPAATTAAAAEVQDGVLFCALAGEESVWVDWMADTGDGGCSTYTVARLCAQPYLDLDPPEDPAVLEAVRDLLVVRTGTHVWPLDEPDGAAEPSPTAAGPSTCATPGAGQQGRSLNAVAELSEADTAAAAASVGTATGADAAGARVVPTDPRTVPPPNPADTALVFQQGRQALPDALLLSRAPSEVAPGAILDARAQAAETLSTHTCTHQYAHLRADAALPEPPLPSAYGNRAAGGALHALASLSLPEDVEDGLRVLRAGLGRWRSRLRDLQSRWAWERVRARLSADLHTPTDTPVPSLPLLARASSDSRARAVSPSHSPHAPAMPAPSPSHADAAAHATPAPSPTSMGPVLARSASLPHPGANACPPGLLPISAQPLPGTGTVSDDRPTAAAARRALDRTASVRLRLPRARVLVCGGDLAYPNPSPESYEDRLILPFEYALPPPPWPDTPGCALDKPQLPPGCPSLSAYPGPLALVLPGNHDWFDGLETYTRYILGKHWLGGWLMPQRSSYFALQLPHGWWLWGVDLALSGDIDAAQFQYFAEVARTRMGPTDRAIVCTHEPTWLLAWHAGTSEPAVLLDLLSTHLRGRCTIRLAGDVHQYVRHTRADAAQSEAQRDQRGAVRPTAWEGEEEADAALWGWAWDRSVACCIGRVGGRRHRRGADTTIGVTPLAPSPGAASTAAAATATAASASAPAAVASAATVEDVLPDPGLPTAGPFAPPAAAPAFPTHLLVSGGGGAFLHPTHPFSHPLVHAGGQLYAHRRSYPSARTSRGIALGNLAKFRKKNWRFDAIAGLLYLALVATMLPMCGVTDYLFAPPLSLLTAFSSDLISPSLTSLHRIADLAAAAPTPPTYASLVGSRCPALEPPRPHPHSHAFPRVNVTAPISHTAPPFPSPFTAAATAPVAERCVAAASPSAPHADAALADAPGPYFMLPPPSPALPAWAAHPLLRLGYLCALFVFRHCALVVSAVASLFLSGSLSAVVMLAFVVVAIGVVPAPLSGVRRLWLGCTHAALHIFAAASLAILFEASIELCAKAGLIGAGGLHDLFDRYRQQEALAFPDPHDFRGMVTRLTFGVYPAAIKWAMTLFDIPHFYALARAALCRHCGALASLSRPAALGYYLAFFAYYWVLITPVCSFLIGCYLYIALNVFNVHWDEGFSSLRIMHFKSFLRMRIDPNGDLHVFCIGVDRTPKRWVEDPFWWRGLRRRVSHWWTDNVPQAWHGLSYARHRPSRWMPAKDQPDKARIVDYFCIRAPREVEDGVAMRREGDSDAQEQQREGLQGREWFSLE